MWKSIRTPLTFYLIFGLKGALNGQCQANCTYSLKDTVFHQTRSFLVINQYDLFSTKTRSNLIAGYKIPFIDSNNNYSRTIFINKISGDTLFNIPSIALTNIQIDTINKMIIGTSSIKYWNEYNIVIISFNGNILFKRSLDVFEAKLNSNEFKSFKKNHPKVFNLLTTRDRIYYDDKNYYISFLGLEINNIDSSAYNFLSKHYIYNHLCPSIKTSGKYLYECYDCKKPFKTLIVKNGIPKKLLLNGCNGNLIKIGLKPFK